MKRSPKFFKSFDSQASLAEIATTSSSSATSHHHHLNNSSNFGGDNINSNMYQPYHSSFNNESNSKDTTHQNKTMFQRSYSTYDLDNPKAFKNFGRQRTDDNQINSFHKTTTNASEISMALPDFVQDHIALEMFYSRGNGSSNISPLSVEYDQLPDFAINDNESNTRLNN